MTALLELQVVREDVDVLHVQRDGQNHLTEEDRITYAIQLLYRKQQCCGSRSGRIRNFLPDPV